MPFDNVAKHAMLAHLATLVTRVSLHFGDPGLDQDNGNSSQTSAPRQQPVWAAPAGGELSLAQNLVFTGGAPNGVVSWIALWDTQASPVRYGKAQLSGTNNFNSEGIFVLTTGTRFRITS